MHADDIEHLARALGPRPPAGRQSDGMRWDRGFARLFDALTPRIAQLIGRYGLTDLREDAEQACAIALSRALGDYDPARSAFATHVTWQMRGELQGLRHRMRLDQRRSAISAGVRTISIEDLATRDEIGGWRVFDIVDEAALPRVERRASDYAAGRLIGSLLDRLDAPHEERVIVVESIFEPERDGPADRRTRERHRQITRRTFRNCARLLAA